MRVPVFPLGDPSPLASKQHHSPRQRRKQSTQEYDYWLSVPVRTIHVRAAPISAPILPFAVLRICGSSILPSWYLSVETRYQVGAIGAIAPWCLPASTTYGSRRYEE